MTQPSRASGSGPDPDMRQPPPTLFAALIDDAAVFPPGNAPLDAALARHRGHRSSGYRGLIGPLLVPAAAARELADLTAGGERLHVVLVARPGEPASRVLDGVAALRGGPVDVMGVELGWSADWRGLGLGGPDDLTVTLEVPRGPGQERALHDVSGAAADGRVRVKFRTGATPASPWPDEPELAEFLVSALGYQVAFKLTGGLHHAVRGTYTVAGAAEEQHGLLNVLCALVHAVGGEPASTLRGVLAERDPGVLARAIAAAGPQLAAQVRASFASYGCCEVTDPVRELTALRLLPEGVC